MRQQLSVTGYLESAISIPCRSPLGWENYQKLRWNLMEFESQLGRPIRNTCYYQTFLIRPIATRRNAAKVLASQYWRPKNGGRQIKLKLKFYYANRPCRFQK